MNDADCIAFLQWALPQLDLHWAGFRKVHRQVCKRIKRRLNRLGIEGYAAYRARLAADPQEWRALDECCHITISRFFRDRDVFETLRRRVLPDIATRAKQEKRAAHCWSAGCAAGEEPYTLKILWDHEVMNIVPGATLSIIATDIDAAVLERARVGCFTASSLRELPSHLVAHAFDRVNDRFCVRPRHREDISFAPQDLRTEAPEGPFDLILCRYVAFTYFSVALQQRALTRMAERLAPRGYLVIGAKERLPVEITALAPLPEAPQIFRAKT